MSPELQAELRAALWPDGEAIPTRLVRCRHCGQRNEVEVPDAVLSPELHDCGACGGPLFLGPDEALRSATDGAYEHPLDRKSLQSLESLPGFAALVRWFMKNLPERVLRYQFLAGAVRCDSDQCPELLELLELAAERLGTELRPTLFLVESPFLNAITGGVDRPALAVHSAVLDRVTDEELVAVLGHELGHLMAEHSTYHVLAKMILFGGTRFVPFGALLTLPLQQALLTWYRASELTADRAGLLACRDLGASLTLLLKFSGGLHRGESRARGLRLGPFIAQARELAALEAGSWIDGAVALLTSMNRTHPFAAWRVMHLVEWVQGGEYLDILAGNLPGARTTPAADAADA